MSVLASSPEPTPITSLLGYLTGRFVTQAENLATEALAYLLRTYPSAQESLIQFLRTFEPELPSDLAFRTQAWLASDGSVPDLVGFDSGADQRVVIEAKFWAGLTPNQPVNYLKRLPAEGPALLAFICPEQHLLYYWNELLRRCTSKGLLVVEKKTGHEAKAATVADRTMVITSWRGVLGRISGTFQAEQNHTGLSDLLQLQGLCEKQDREAFQPLLSEELSGSTGRRIIQFRDLITEATQVLVKEELASTAGLSSSASQDFIGRYLQIGGWECLLHINFSRWANLRATPIWLQVTDRRAKRYRPLLDALAPLRNAVPPRLIDDDGKLQLPVYLPMAVDREAVLQSMLEQLRDLSALISSCPAV